MKNNEAIEELHQIDTDLMIIADCGNKTSERIIAGRKRNAVQAAIKALENQPRMQCKLESLNGIADKCDKLENALSMLVHDLAVLVKKITLEDTSIDVMTMEGVNRYKRTAGINLPKDNKKEG